MDCWLCFRCLMHDAFFKRYICNMYYTYHLLNVSIKNNLDISSYNWFMYDGCCHTCIFLGYEWAVWYCGQRRMSTCYSPFTNNTDGVCRRFELTGHQDMFKTYGLDEAQLHWVFFVDIKNRYIIIYIYTCIFTHSSWHLLISPGWHFAKTPTQAQCDQWYLANVGSDPTKGVSFLVQLGWPKDRNSWL